MVRKGSSVRVRFRAYLNAARISSAALSTVFLKVIFRAPGHNPAIRRVLPLLGLIAALALPVSGCGGDETVSTTATTGEPAATIDGGEAFGAEATSAENGAAERSGDSQEGGSGASQEDGSGASEGSSTDSPADDGKSGLAEEAKSDVKGFQPAPGGDDSIQTFGGEPESTEETEILAAMGSFLRAMASDDYPAICAGITQANREQLDQLLKIKKEATGCPSLLKTLLIGPDTEARRAAEGTVYEVRVDGDKAFILFTPKGGTASYFMMKHDPDGWRSTSIGTGTPFDPNAP
jgi:hypothetical protein